MKSVLFCSFFASFCICAKAFIPVSRIARRKSVPGPSDRHSGITFANQRQLISTESSLDLNYIEIKSSSHESKEEETFALPPVILIHGLLGQIRNFKSWAEELKEKHLDANRRLFVVDLRNHGDSPHHKEMGYHHMAGDIVKLLDRMRCEKAVLAGHSMGGKVAMATAMLAPGRVEGVCVIDIAPVRYTTVDGSDWRLADALIRELIDLPLSKWTNKRDVDTHLSRSILDPSMRQFALTNVDQIKGELQWKINLEAISKQLDVIAGAEIGGITGIEPFRGQTLFVKGGASRYIVEELHLSRTKGFFPAATMEVIENAGHWVHQTHPRELHSVLSDFLRMEQEE